MEATEGLDPGAHIPGLAHTSDCAANGITSHGDRATGRVEADGRARVARRQVIAGIAGVAASGVWGGAAVAAADFVQPSYANAGDERVLLAFDKIYKDVLEANPELAGGSRGGSRAARARLTDRSAAADRIRAGIWRTGARALLAIPEAGLSPLRVRQRNMALFFLDQVATARERYSYGDDRFFAYRLTQFTGAYVSVPLLLRQTGPLRSQDDVADYMSRLGQFGQILDQDTERQAQDGRDGIVAPTFVLDQVLANLRQATGSGGLAETLLVSLQGAGSASIEQARRLLLREVMPALERQIAETARLRTTAVDVPGVWRLPDGDSFYRDALYASLSSRMDPEDAHRLGLEKVREIEATLDAMLRKQEYSRGSCMERIEAIRADPAQYFSADDQGREAVLAYFREDVRKVQAALSAAFATLPLPDLQVERLPLALEGVGPVAAYQPPSPDGAHPGTVQVDLKDMTKLPRFSLKTLCRHEGIPGHHLQASLMRGTDVPDLFKLFYNAAYFEGWALYAEQLSQEMGLYADDPMGEIGMWQSLLYRAARIVTDTGIHHRRWSRERALSYMLTTTGMPRPILEAEINRYAIIPGQACGYMLGQMGWRRARERAERAQGSAFDLRAFHQILGFGPMPMAMLDELAIASGRQGGGA